MPIYEYVCSNCGQKTDILQGINEPTPPFCPECGAEGTLRKAFAPPAIVFKGSGWAKKDRAASRRSSSSSGSSKEAGESKGSDGDSGSSKAAGTSDSATSSSSSSSGSSGD
jgi:putative FmdB family regulatory protein